MKKLFLYFSLLLSLSGGFPISSAWAFDDSSFLWNSVESANNHSADIFPVAPPYMASRRLFAWKSLADLTTSRSQFGVASLPNQKIYVWGGYAAGNTIISSMEIFDAATGSWSAGADYPIAARGVAYATDPSGNGTIYSFGGSPTDGFYKYDPQLNLWTTLALPGNPAWYAAATVGLDGKVYVFGGENSLTATRIYDPVTNSWAAGAAMPTGRYATAVLRDNNGLIHVIGGATLASSPSNKHEVYNPATNTWTTATPLPQDRMQAGYAVKESGNLLYIIGGKIQGNNNSAPFFSDAFVYNVSTATWSTDTSLPVGLGESAAIAVGETIYYIGGTNGTPVKSVYSLGLTVNQNIVNVSCFGESNGSISLTAQGGTAPYSYLWSTGETGPSRSGLTAGTYSVTVTDATNEQRTITVEVTQPAAALSVTTAQINVRCNGASNGSIDLTTSGGSPGYTYLWSDGATTEDRLNLPMGTYTVTITDAKGCTKSASVTLTQPEVMTLDPTNPPDGNVGEPYFTSLGFTGGSGIHSWTFISGIIPLGITFGSGDFYGTPTLAGSYTMRIRLGDTGCGTQSTMTYTIVVKNRRQDITFGTLPTKVYGDVDFSPGATSSNAANPIIYTSSDPAVATIIAGNMIHIIGQGSTVITANQAIVSGYEAAAPQTQTLAVSPRPITVSANTGQSKIYGDAEPVYTYAPFTLVGSDAFTGNLSRAGGTVVGTYAITQGNLDAGANYTLTFASADFSINPRPLTVLATGINKIYDGSTSATVVLSDNRLSGESFTTNYAIATFADANVNNGIALNAGGISIAGAGAANYSLTNNTATTTADITSTPLTIKATGPAKAFGQALTAGTSTLNFTAGTTQNSEVVSSVTLTPDAAGASATTPAGTPYTVTPSLATGSAGFLASNYNITYMPFNGIVGQTVQTITFSPLANATYGVAPIALTASSTSGLAVSYSSSNPAVATVSGNTLTVVGAGTTIITASQNNNTNFTPATPVDQSFTVDPKAITVTADARTKVYGVVDPALTYTITPLVGTDTFSGALSRLAGENIGTYAIGQNTLALSSNYTLSYVGANLTITTKPVTVTATAGQTKVYGTADPVFAYTMNTPLIGTDAFTGTLTRAAGENIGIAYGITQGNLALSSNYTITYTGSNFAITAKPVTVIADAKTKEYGSVDPVLTFTTDVALIGTDAFTGNISRTAGENAGTYEINKNTLALSSNYTLSYTTANLSITKKALTITADSKVKFQGTANPALTASYAGFISGENNTNLITQAALSTTATNVSVAGSYTIVVSAATSNNYAITFVAGTLTITSGIPTSLSLAQATLYENRPAGTTAGAFSSTSLDPGATFTYTLVTGTGSTDNGSFSISGNQLLTAQSFDFETKNAYNIRIRTTTQYGLSLEQTFTVNISDVNEVPTLSAVADQAICYVTGTQSVALAGITAGPETAQSTTISVSSNNPNLFGTFAVSKSGTTGTLSYSAKTGASGTATVTVTVQDNGGTANSGTDTFTRTFTITVFALPTPSITSNKGNSVGKGETIQLTATGGTSYVWAANSSILSGQNTAVLTLRPSVTTTYTVTATNANGCSASTSFTIEVESDYTKLKSTNLLTPNNDGINDKWVITNIDLYGNNEAKVFDVAGRLVYSKKNYDNSWDGSYNGAPLSEGTYYYVVDFGPGKGRLKGFITIIREQ